MKTINNIIIDKLVDFNLWWILGISILVSELFTAIIVSVMSIIFYGNIRYDYLITGFAAALFVSLIVVYTLTLLIQRLIYLNEKNIQDIAKLKDTENILKEKTLALNLMNNNLEGVVNEKLNEIRQKEVLLIQQSKMAAMGKMIESITHQWRQPLNIIGILIQDLKDSLEYNELDKTYINNTVKEAMAQVKFMSKTMNDFKNFFKPSLEKETFDLIRIAADVFSLLSHQLINNNINYKINCHVHNKSFNHYSEVIPCEATMITSYKSYLFHVILNIINNSNDAIVKLRKNDEINRDKKGIINVDVYRNNGSLRMAISDNGGGIDDKIINRIFEPYFTTKNREIGAGIGLYMSKMIVEDALGGKIHASNIDNGTEISLELRFLTEE